MTEIFDKPQYSLTLLKDSQGEFTSLPLELTDENCNVLKRVKVYPPTQLVTFLFEVAKVESLDEVILYLDKHGKSWVFGVSVKRGDYDLWHYTPSTEPAWLKRVVK